MFQLIDNFSCFDDNKIPYSLEIERHTEVENMHCAVENGEFQLKSIGNRFIFRTPALSSFVFKMNIGFTCLYEFSPTFFLLFGYDKRKRQGNGIRFELDLTAKTLVVSYVLIDKMKVNEQDRCIFPDVSFTEGKRYALTLKLREGVLSGDVTGNTFSFEVGETTGYLAIERKNFIGVMSVAGICITSDDDMIKEVLAGKRTVNIPLLNGGDIPYSVSWEIYKENEMCYADVSLLGGTSARKENKDDRPGQYLAEVDVLKNPYVIFSDGVKSEKKQIGCGELVITDQNIFWDCLNEYWNSTKLPIKKKIPVIQSIVCKDLTVTYGYEGFCADGYNMQAGAAEFIYDTAGTLIYGGEPLNGNVYSLVSPIVEGVKKHIPEKCYKREDVLRHFEGNHYFGVHDDIELELIMKTKLNAGQISVKAEIRDVYGREIVKTLRPDVSIKEWKFGYSELFAKITSAAMPEKLYRAVFYISYGGRQIDKYEKVFEVFDEETNISPAVASGLPYVLSMPNEQKWLERNGFDVWNPMPSCDSCHYISVITDTPIEAKRRRVWEFIKPFKRVWFLWLSDRTAKVWQAEKHIDVIKNCDYLYYPAPIEIYPLRNDLHLLQTYNYLPGIQKMLKEFLDLHPEFKEKLSFDVCVSDEVKSMGMLADENEKGMFTYENIKELFDLCHAEWIDFATKRFRENIREQNNWLRSINPKIRRSAYGIFNQYSTCTLSYHTARDYGMIPDESLIEDVYTGFAVFEDYPYSCNYPTYRGAFAVMTILLHVPELRIYPEQYCGSSLGGCIDGAVKFAHPPMGAYPLEPYQNSTLSFEYVYNTPYRTEDGYRYWSTYGFHRRNFDNEMWDKLVRDWHYVLDYKPKMPLKTVGFVAEYTDNEDELDTEIKTLHNTSALNNRSESAHGFLYECCREAGLNAGFAIKFETLKNLTADECDILFLPTLEGMSNDILMEIRRLHHEGVRLAAVSSVCGLEDIFKVKPAVYKKEICSITYGDESEYIYPKKANFYYKSDGAECVLWAEGNEAILKTESTILFNTATYELGYECFEGTPGKARKNTSMLYKRAVIESLGSMARPLVRGEDVAITLFETEKGETMLLVMDHTPFDNRTHGVREAVVSLNMAEIIAAESDRELSVIKKPSGGVTELRFTILPNETVFIKLKK